MKRYKVWIEIEEYDEDSDEGVDLPLLDFASTAIFANADDARLFAIRLNAVGMAMTGELRPSDDTLLS